MIHSLTSEKGFTLYLAFISLLLISGLTLHVASLYDQEVKWFELERKEALFNHAKFEAMEEMMQSRELHEFNDRFNYKISGVQVQIQITCFNDQEIWYRYKMTYRDTEREDLYQWLIDDHVYRLVPQGATCS